MFRSCVCASHAWSSKCDPSSRLGTGDGAYKAVFFSLSVHGVLLEAWGLERLLFTRMISEDTLLVYMI
jgi:hypothetical protein